MDRSTAELGFVRSGQTFGDTRTFGVAAADVDQDGDIDLFFANYIGASRLWINDGHGNFTESPQNFNATATTWGEAHDVAFGDLNGDTAPDLVIAFHGAPSVVFLNDGAGNFTALEQRLGGTEDYPQTVQIEDIDNDSDLDVLLYNSNAADIVWYNDGNGSFTAGGVDLGGSGSTGLLLADFTNDHVPDLYVRMRDSVDQLWINNGSGTFTQSAQTFDVTTMYVQAIDLEGDGDQDIAVSENSRMLFFLNENGTGTFTQSGSLAEGAEKFALFDADLDGDADLATFHPDNGNKFWVNEGGSSFTATEITFGTARVLGKTTADVDGDNDTDIILGLLEGGGGNPIYLNTVSTNSVKGTGEIRTGCLQLHPNYPNPFNPATTIPFELTRISDVVVRFYDINGRLVAKVAMGQLQSGMHKFVWNSRNHKGHPLPSGPYFFQMDVEGVQSHSIKLLLMK